MENRIGSYLTFKRICYLELFLIRFRERKPKKLYQDHEVIINCTCYSFTLFNPVYLIQYI